MDFLSNQILLPLDGIFIAIFVGLVMNPKHVLSELGLQRGFLLNTWFFLLKYVASVMVALILILAVFFGVTV